MIFIKLHHYILFFICNTWEQRKLGELAEIVGGGTPSTSVNSYWDGDIDWYAPAEIGEQIYLESSQLKITEEGLNKSSAKILPIGTVLFTSRAGIGKTAILQKEGCTNQGFQSIVPNKEKLDSYFIFTRSEELKRYGETVGAGSTFVEVSGKQMANMELMMPKTMPEQQQIGEFFANLDHLITLHQRKCDDTKELKKYMLQKMFPKNGEKFPEIRFKGFTEAWEQRKLIDVCDYVDYRGKTPTKTDSGVFLVTAKNVKDGYIDYGVSQEYISEDDYEEVMHRGKPEIGDVLITTEAPCGNVAQVNRADIALAQRIIKYRGQSNIVDNTYLKDYLQSPEFQNILNAKSSGGTVKGIKGSILHQQEIKYPKYEEQFKIGSYFNNLDNLITLHQRKYSIIYNKLITWEQRKLGDLLNETREKTSVEDEDTLLSCAIQIAFTNIYELNLNY